MNLQQLKIFCEVYRQRGYSQAAKKLGLTQSAVSQQVKALEKDLSVELFDKVNRARATAAGEYLFREAGLILAAADDVRRGIMNVCGVSKGLVRFGMIDVAAIELMPAALSAFKRDYPNVKVEAVVKTSGELIEMVDRHELDFVLAVTNRLPEHLTSRVIYSDSIVAVVPARSHMCKPKLSIANLRGEPLILYPMSSHTRLVIEDAFRAHGIVPAVNMEMHYPAAICSLVRQGMGIGLISMLSAKENRLRGQVAIPIKELCGAMRIGLIFHKKRRLSPQAKALMATVEKMVANKKNEKN